MKTNCKLTKQEVRDLLRMLAERRQQSTPQHKDPAWCAQFWRRIASA